MRTEKTLVLKPHQIDEAARLLSSGKLVAFPTETVYGLGAPIFLEQAVRAIFTAKGRPSDNPLIAHISHLREVDQIAREIPDCFEKLVNAFFPGPLTVVLKRHPHVPQIVSAGLDTIALRMPAHPLARELIALVGQPLVAPSANLSGKPSATDSAHVLHDFEGKIGAVLDGGKTQYGIESTVLSLLGPVPMILRPGSITREQITDVLGVEVQIVSETSEGPVLSPGMKYKHYAPQASVRIFKEQEALLSFILEAGGKRQLILSRLNPDIGKDHLLLSGAEFYRSLRLADELGYEEILIYCDQTIQSDAGLMNRICRSSALY